MQNSKFKIQNLRILFLLCVLCVSVVNSFSQSFDFLAEQIRRGSVESKRDALYQIKVIQSAEASRIAVPALQDSNEIVRATAVYSIIYLPSDEAAQSLLPLLPDKSILVRKETAYALGKTRSQLAVQPLLRILQSDKELEVRIAAAVALGEIGDIRAINELVKILQRTPKNEEDFLRRSAARAIGQITQFRQVNNTYVVTPESLLPEKYDTLVNLNYENLLTDFPGYRQAVQVLLSVVQNLKESDDTRREAAFALGTFGDKSVIPILQNTLNAKDYYLAEICKESLQKIESAKSTQN